MSKRKNHPTNPIFRNTSDPQSPLLTPKQKAVLDFILQSSETNGYAPSQQEIAQHFGFSSLGTVQNYLVRLERQGVLSKKWNGKRALQPHSVPPGSEGLELPLLGKVAAGKPIEALISNETLNIPAIMKAAKKETFALKVQGQSMIEDGILDGDYVIVAKQNYAENGQTVVATLHNEATIKRYYKRESWIELQPANEQMSSILVHNEDQPNFRIEGVLMGVLRTFK